MPCRLFLTWGLLSVYLCVVSLDTFHFLSLSLGKLVVCKVALFVPLIGSWREHKKVVSVPYLGCRERHGCWPSHNGLQAAIREHLFHAYVPCCRRRSKTRTMFFCIRSTNTNRKVMLTLLPRQHCGELLLRCPPRCQARCLANRYLLVVSNWHFYSYFFL